MDIGTNCTRLLIADVATAQVILPIFQAERITRLGEGLGDSGLLNDAAMTRVIAALMEYRSICDGYRVQEHQVMATSATRDARNRELFLQRVLQETGFQIRLLSGEQEARLSFIGALSDQPDLENVLVCDIGGGSTEFVFGGRRAIQQALSIDIGSRRLTEQFFSETSTVQQAMAQCREFCRQELWHFFPTVSRPGCCLAVGGTASTLAMMTASVPIEQPEKIHGYRLSLRPLSALVEHLAVLTIPQRQLLVGLHPDRADVILTGAIIVETIMSFFNLDFVDVSLRDLLYGIFLEEGL